VVPAAPPYLFCLAALCKEYGGNNKTLLHHDESKAKWRPVHCFPNVASERTDVYAMSSVHSSIGMRRRNTTALLCLFRNRVRIELSLKEQHKVTISGSLILVFSFFVTYLHKDKMMDDPYKLPLPTIPHKTMAVHGTPRSAGGVLLHAGVLPLPQRRYEFAATAAAAAAAAEAEARQRRRG
jgi:hypothetical protein